MANPETQLERSHESLSKTIESQLEKQQVTAGLNVTTQSVQGQTPKLCITVYWLEIEIYSFYCQVQQKLKEIWDVNDIHKNSHRNHTHRIFYKNILRSINQSLHSTGCMHTTNYFATLGILYIRDAGRRGNKSLTTVHLHYILKSAQRQLRNNFVWNSSSRHSLIFQVVG